MIPYCLQIKNFLSYGDEIQTIDFRPHHLIYLSGKNGHGKSALLDAMTWALWGAARKTTNAVKPDQGLLRLGATQMLVIFDFELGGQLYRVKREFIQAAGGKPLAYLEFGIVNPDGSITALTDKTIRATQDVIEKTIRLDYESFTNSAFLRQGHANEFSQKSPKDRKEILGNILGLGQFEQLKRRALDRAKQAIVERQAITAVQDSITQQLLVSQAIEQQSSQLKVDIAAIKKDDAALALERSVWQKKQILLQEKQKGYDQLIYKQEQQEILYKEQLEQMLIQVAKWRQLHRRQLAVANHQELEKEKKRLAANILEHQKKMQARLETHAKVLQLKEQLHIRKQELEKNFHSNLQKLEIEIEKNRFEKEAEKKQIKNFQEKITALEVQQKKYEQEIVASQQKGISPLQLQKQIEQFDKRKNAYQQYAAKGNWLKAELSALDDKRHIAELDNPSCPLCEQNLSAARKKFLSNRFSKQYQLLSHQFKRLSGVIARLKQVTLDQHAHIELIKKQLQEQQDSIKESQKIGKELFELSKSLQAAHEQTEKIEKTTAQREKLLAQKKVEAKQLVENDTQFVELHTSLKENEKKLDGLKYDEKAHQQEQKKIQEIEKQIADLMQLHQELLSQPERAHSIHIAITALKEKKKVLSFLQKERTAYASFEKELKELKENEDKLSLQAKAIQERKEKARELHGRIKTQQEQVIQLKKEQEKHALGIATLNKEIEDYQTIAAAAGKDGIQALLIEEAVPEIEQEANVLLSRLTNNQSQIFIESLRDLKRGGSKETLDINIADPSGIRPYEMFSGGEAFRIDFALRIAISKLLARRAGTSLQTLIIDEGFGSQDEEGLSLIMDAIYKIQDDFQKVIVVSHLPGMHDQFPVHFVVKKRPNGSRISVVEQG